MLGRSVPFVLVCVLAFGRALTSPVKAPRQLGGEDLRRRAYLNLVNHETESRRKAVEDFPTDPWSQSDAFQALEAGTAQSFADAHHISLSGVLLGLDQGMRTDRARGAGVLTASVPPCHPRVIY